MTRFTWDGLVNKNLKDLDNIKRILQNKLYEVRKESFVKIQNILSLQGMIEDEKGKGET